MKKLLYFIICFVLFSNPLFSQEEEKLDEGEEKSTQDVAKHPLLADKFWIEAGVYFPTKSIKIGANASLPEDEIDFNETFGIDDSQTTYLFNFEWRWNKNWRLTAETFAVNNSSRATLKKDLVFNEITFQEGTNVGAGFNFSLYRVFVGRLISSGQKHSLGAGLGVHALDVGAFVEGEIKSDNPDLNGSFRRSGVNALVPLPNIGAWYHWAPTEKWAFIARVDWFGISIDQYSGGLWDLAPGVRYQFIKNFGIGLDYRFFLLNAKVDNDNWKGKFDMDFSGPSITLHGNF